MANGRGFGDGNIPSSDNSTGLLTKRTGWGCRVASIIVATDGSVSYDHTVASWACYIITPDEVVRFGGVLPISVDYNPLIAESMAVAYALDRVDAMVDNLSDHDLVIYTDCRDVMYRAKRTKGAHLSKKQIMDTCQHILDKFAHYRFVLVKGHSKIEDLPHTMNRWCDMEARRLLRKAVEKSRKNTIAQA